MVAIGDCEFYPQLRDYESMGAPPLASNDCCTELSKRDGNHDVDGNVAILHIPICDDIPTFC